MAGIKGKISAKGLTEYQRKLKCLNEQQRAAWNEAVVRDLAGRLLKMVIKLTPKGDYRKKVKVTAKRNSKHHKKGEVYTKYESTGKQGGTLQERWKVGEVKRSGNEYSIEVFNNVKYAPYVEFGHRKVNNKGWVEGRWMLTISEMELQKDAPRILILKLNKLFKDVFE